MKLSISNFLSQIKNIVTGGGRDSDNNARHDAGFLATAKNVSLQSLTALDQVTQASTVFTTINIGGTADSTLVAVPFNATWSQAQADVINDNFEDVGTKINNVVADIAAIKAKLGLAADETNAKVLKVEEAVDTVGVFAWPVPADYDEATDELKVRVLASQLTVSTDNDVQLDAQVYKKVAGSALGSDLDPTIPSTILSTTEQWVEFNLTGNSFRRDNVMYFKLITDGHNDTDGEEVLIHAVEVKYRSTLVSYDAETSAGVALR